MKTRFFGILALLLAVALPAAAADLAGRWTAEFDSPIGVQKYVYEFKKSGDAVTGEATYDHSMGKGTVPLSNIKVDGDKVTFTENASFMEMPLSITYTGNFAGNDEIKFTRVVVADSPETFVAKRSK